jgi:hypothetical protein
MKNNQLITLVLVISIIFSCSKDEPIVEPPKETPKVTTKVYENLTHNSVILVGEVISEGSSSIIEQGFYYTEGTSAEKKIIISIGSKNFKVDLKILPNTGYSYWAYAKNSVGEQRGNQFAFTSDQDPRYSNENIVLKTQAEVDEFVKREMIEIGSLTLGEESVKNDITDISKLNTLTKLLGELKILNTKINNTEAFTNLTIINGDVIIQDNNELENIDKMGQVEILNSSDIIIKNNPKLKLVKNLGASTSNVAHLKIEDNLELTSIEGFKNIEKIYVNSTNNESIIILNNKKLINLKGLEKLKKTAGVIIRNNESLESLDGLSENLESLDNIKIYNNKNLQNINVLSSYSKAGSVNLNNLPNLRSLSGLKNIAEIGGLRLSLNSSYITNLDDLKNLKTVNYTLFINGDYYVDGVSALDSNNYIKSIDGLNNLEKCNDMYFHHLHGVTDFPKFPNLSQLNSLQIFDNDFLKTINSFENLETVTNEFRITKNINLIELSSFNSLTIAKDFTIANNNKLPLIKGFNNLTIANDFTIVYNYKISSINGFEKLKTIDGDFEVLGNDVLTTFDKIKNIETVKGNLHIEGGHSGFFGGYINLDDKIEDLNWLSNLKTVEGDLKIIYSSSLKSLCGLQNLLSNDGLKGNYIVNNNLFNPTKQEIIDGNCSQ